MIRPAPFKGLKIRIILDCRTDWTKFGFTDGTLTGDYKDTLSRLREEARERFEMLISSPLIVAELTEALIGLSLDHQDIIDNGHEVR